MKRNADITAFVAEHGIAVCPPSAAAVMGEATPGWRREVERRTETAAQKNSRKTKQIGGRIRGLKSGDQECLPVSSPRPKKNATLFCRYFDKVAIVYTAGIYHRPLNPFVLSRIRRKYGASGARFWVAEGPNVRENIHWNQLQPMLARAVKRTAG